ncbi:hypothetical protein DSO57_1034575 [Entomophthora muscae]|uniref:Uncharacterized protein n=1 Tax=Entomophthora muscae TaxID=34485 RepID=A0ACC2TLJ4_9FUNG|nr:hypothetical protein DSO57_1034575 [Entomophthora muscae]
MKIRPSKPEVLKTQTINKFTKTKTMISDLSKSLDSTCGVPVHLSPNCVLNCIQGPAGRDCHSLGSKWAFIHSQKEDPLRNLLVYDPGVKETIWICQYLESFNNILDSLYLVLDSCTLVLDSCTLNLDSSAVLRIQLLILGIQLSL